jgi:glycosyltransferase involved in cell wall biosynthesis
MMLGWPTDRPVFFVLRRLEARMGLDNLLRALAIVRERGYQFHAVIGGNGSQLARLTNLRNDLGLESEVTFMGFVPGDKLALAYAACDASIVPTANLECFGIIALEALACGCTTLVTSIGALPEVMAHFEPKWIARGHLPDDIADLVSSYLTGELPAHNSEVLRATLMARYSFLMALNSYDRILSVKHSSNRDDSF